MILKSFRPSTSMPCIFPRNHILVFPIIYFKAICCITSLNSLLVNDISKLLPLYNASTHHYRIALSKYSYSSNNKNASKVILHLIKGYTS